MTSKTLAWSECPICKRSFMKYVYGHFLPCDILDHEDLCFYDNTIGEFHNNNPLNPLAQKCYRCRINNQLEMYS